MIAKAKVISHGANAIRYSVDKDKAEIVKTNLLPDDISPTAMWARMLALQKKFEDKLNRYHPLKRNMIRIEVSPTSEETQGWTMEEWQRLADDFIREFDAVDLSAKSKRKSAKATNLKDSQYVVALHRDSKSGIMHLHIDANRIDIRGNVNDAHYIYERAMAAAAKVGQQRGWKDAQEVSRQNKDAITNDCLSVLAKMPYFDWGLYTKCLTQTGYDVKLQSDNKGQVRGYAIKRGNSIYKSSELGKGRCLMPSKIEGTWAKLHHQELEKPVSTPTKNTWKIQCKLPPKTKRFCPLKTFNNAPLKSLDRWGYYYFSLFPSVCSHFTDTFSCQLNPVRRMYNTIHNGICYCRVSDCIIPIVRWQLRGDDDGLAPMSVLYYIEQDGSFLGIKVHKEEVIQYEQRAPFDSLEFRFQCAFYFCHLKRTHKFRSIRIICPYALLAGFIPHCCGKEALPGTG